MKQRLTECFGEEGIEYVILLPTLSEERSQMLDGEKAWDDLYLDYCHLNDTGLALAADALVENANLTTSSVARRQDAQNPDGLRR